MRNADLKVVKLGGNKNHGKNNGQHNSSHYKSPFRSRAEDIIDKYLPTNNIKFTNKNINKNRPKRFISPHKTHSYIPSRLSSDIISNYKLSDNKRYSNDQSHIQIKKNLIIDKKNGININK